VERPQALDSTPKLQDIIAAARPHLSNRKFQELEEPLAEYEDIFAVDSKDYRWANRMYHRIDTGDARPIFQSPRRLPLEKQAEISKMLNDMQRRWVMEESDSP
jgi:hypothetical protein